MDDTRYVAYVGTYTHGSSLGIHIYDVDPDTWSLEERNVVPINNPSDLIVSNNGKYLYSVADEGIRSFRILADGDLEPINSAWTGAMRGCYLETDEKDQYLFIAGYHDGSVTMMYLNQDGSVGQVADNIFHEGVGKNITECNYMPHVTCVKMLPDQSAVCAVDSGLDQVKLYQIEEGAGKLKLQQIIRAPLNSAPRMLRFHKTINYAYLLCGQDNSVSVYRFEKNGDGIFEFEEVQEIQTVKEDQMRIAAASGIEFSPNGNYLFVSNAGINTVTVFQTDLETGRLTEVCSNKISGDYPKTLAVMPDGKHFVTLNHQMDEICTFNMNYEKKYFLMDRKPISIEQPNCIYVHRLR